MWATTDSDLKPGTIASSQKPGPACENIRGNARLSGVDLRPYGVDSADRWPRHGEVVLLRVTVFEKANFTISPELYPNPTVILTDMSNYIKCQPEVFVPESG